MRFEDFFNFAWCEKCENRSYCSETNQCQLELNLDKAEALRDEGMRQAREAQRNAEWLMSAYGCYHSLPRGSSFSAITISEAVGLPSAGEKRNNAMGGFFGSLSKAHRIEPIGSMKSERVPRKANRITIWKKLW